jgi:pyruvate dehydrogenase E1 component alpha subunit
MASGAPFAHARARLTCDFGWLLAGFEALVSSGVKNSLRNVRMLCMAVSKKITAPKAKAAKATEAKPSSNSSGQKAAREDIAGVVQRGGDLEPFQILAPDGKPVRADLIPDLEVVEAFYRKMSLLRYMDDKFMELFKSQKLGNYAQFGGQEASQIGSASALEARDYIAPMYRSTGAMITHGWPMHKAIMYWRGHPEGWRLPDNLNILPIIISIPGQYVHAAGAAMGLKAQGSDAVCMTYIGEGGTSQGDFHIAVNFASATNAPAVFVVENNGWAISVPRAVQSKVDNLVRRSEGYGIPGYLVDGNDILAVNHVNKIAVADARAGKGPSLIEQMTYRIRPHTTGDDPKAYRSDEEPNFWIANRDPIQRVKKFLELEGRWNDDREVAMHAEIESEFNAALEAADNAAAPNPLALLEYTMVNPGANLIAQQAELEARIREANA